MIRAKRTPGVEPESLDKKYKDGKTELERATEHYITENTEGSFEFDRYRSADVKRKLDEIFHGKCAYCESFYSKTQPVDVEHYRPKGAVDGEEEHRGYWWLAMDWKNLLPSCIDCNRKRKQRTPKPDERSSMVELNADGDFVRGKTFKSGKQSAFPLSQGSPRARWDTEVKNLNINVEERLLLDPTRDEPEEHLVFHVDRREPEKMISIVYPKPLAPGGELVLPVLGGTEAVAENAGGKSISAIGAVSIQVYGLNRLSLVQARTKMLRDLEFMLELSVSLNGLSSALEDRIQNRKAQISSTHGTTRSLLEEDLELDQKISAQISELSEKVINQMTNMTKPEAEYSALAKAWMAAFVSS